MGAGHFFSIDNLFYHHLQEVFLFLFICFFLFSQRNLWWSRSTALCHKSYC